MFKVIRDKMRLNFKSQPGSIRPQDSFLVSYPKSGNTWLRFILANILKQDNELIDFHSVINYVPEIGNHDDTLAQLADPRIIKSHSLHNQDYPRVIYIVRDPRDVYVSYYHYLKKKLPRGINFSEFLRMPDIYPSRWHIHVESWLNNASSILIIKYEDLLADTCREIEKTAQFLFDYPIPAARIKQAIIESSFDKMQEIELAKGRPFKTKECAATATTFVRQGKHGDWKNYFLPEDENFLLAEAGKIMKIFNYV